MKWQKKFTQKFLLFSFFCRWCLDNSPPVKVDMYGSTSSTPPPTTSKTTTTTTPTYVSHTTPETSYLPPSKDNYGSKSLTNTAPERLTLLPPPPPPPRSTLPPTPSPTTRPTFPPPPPSLPPPPPTSIPTTRAPLSSSNNSGLIYIKVSK